MSYSRQYHEAIQERVSWSYKDSEGHTHHESKVVNIPIDINISVETDPFDGSIVKTVSSVDSLTGAIASMKAVQCATVKENAEKISGRIVFRALHCQCEIRNGEQ